MLPLNALLFTITEPVVGIIDAIALVLIAMATVVVFVRVMRLAPRGHLTNVERRDLCLGYGRWLVAGLTMQLSADIIELSIYAKWDAIGQLAAVAVIRTFLNYFLERDIADVRERQRATRPAP